MSDGLNKVILIGHLGADPESRVTTSGKNVTNFRIATSESWKGDDGVRKQATEWHNIVTWGKLATVVSEYMTKGAMVYVEGKLKTRKWTDNENRDRYTTEVVANKVLFLGGRNNNQSQSQSQSQPINNASADDDIPF